MARPGGLGRGLRALISPDATLDSPDLVHVSVDDILPNPYQPRRGLDEERLKELADSVRTHGVVQPLVARRCRGKEGKFELIVGERRWRAAKMVGLKTVPAIIRQATEPEMLEIALLENLQREDLNPLEQAESFRRLIEEFSLTQEELAGILGRSRSAIANILRLLSLEPQVQESVSRGTLSMGHARALVSITDPEVQVRAARRIEQEDMSVRAAEDLARRIHDRAPGSTESERPQTAVQKDPALAEAVEQLMLALGTKVSLRGSRAGGRIEVFYYSEEELDRLLDILASGTRPPSSETA